MQIRWIPCRHDDPSVRWIVPDCVNHCLQLVVSLTGVVGVHVDVFCTKVSPLESIDGSQVALLPISQASAGQEFGGRVAIPDVDALAGQFVGVCGSTDEPQQLLQDALEETRLVVKRGRVLLERLNRSCSPKIPMVPVPVLSVLMDPTASIFWMSAKYCSSSGLVHASSSIASLVGGRNCSSANIPRELVWRPHPNDAAAALSMVAGVGDNATDRLLLLIY